MRFGSALAEAGVGIVYGGGHVGLMGSVADGALATGGEVIGVIPRSLVEAELAHRGLTRLEVVDSLHDRKARMAALADGFVALPGGAGTLDEWFEAWTWGQLGLHAKPLALLDVGGFWRPLAAMLDHLVTTGFLAAHHRDSLVVEDDARRLLERLQTWAPPVPKWVDGSVRLSSVGLVVIRDGRLLVARSHGADAFFLPGGKLEDGETERDALRREVREELGIDLEASQLEPSFVVEAAAYGQAGVWLRMSCYTAAFSADPVPRSEIAELAWISDDATVPLAPAVVQAMTRLRLSGCL